MEFWGVEVKPGESLKVQPEFGKLIHISQAALGEVTDVKDAYHVPLRLKIDDKDFIFGALSAEERPQLMLDLVFEKDFVLSHDWKTGSVYLMGYIGEDPVSDGDDFFDDLSDESEDEPLGTHQNGVIKPKMEEAVKATKIVDAAKAGSKKGEEDNSESDSDDEMADSSDMSGEDSEEEDGSSEEELPKAKQSKKRPAESTPEALIPSKKAKAKSATPDKTGNKKGLKAAGKAPVANKRK